jgi:hypothetical protein
MPKIGMQINLTATGKFKILHPEEAVRSAFCNRLIADTLPLSFLIDFVPFCSCLINKAVYLINSAAYVSISNRTTRTIAMEPGEQVHG